MKQFQDSTREKRSWDVAITIGAAARVKELAGIDLLDLTGGDPPVGVRITTEPLLFGAVLYAVCKRQADELKIDRAAFLDLLDGEAMAAAFAAFCEDLTDFFRKAGRPEQETALRKQMHVLEAAGRMIEARFQTLDVDKMMDLEGAKLDRKLQKIMQDPSPSPSGSTSGSSPELSASIPAP